MGSFADESPGRLVTPAFDAGLLELGSVARRYLERWGVSSPTVLALASERVALEVSNAMPGRSREAQGQAVVELTRRWVERFLDRSSELAPGGLFRARAVLLALPQVLLDVAMPPMKGGGDDDALVELVLPEPAPSPMREQDVEGAPVPAWLRALLGDELGPEPVGEP